jgi:hypothetical protein
MGLQAGEKKTRLTISNKWSHPVPVEYGKNIVVRFSKEYFLVTVKITGEEGVSFTRTLLGKAEQIIEAHNIRHIRNPMISFLTEVDEKIGVDVF